MTLVEAAPGSGSVHLWMRTLPGSMRFRSLCGSERHKSNLTMWGLTARKRCTDCSVTAGILAANGIDVAVVPS